MTGNNKIDFQNENLSEHSFKVGKTETLNIDELDEQIEKQSRLVVLTSVIKKIGLGTNLDSMALPGGFILPESTICYFGNYYSNYFDILLKANEIEDKVQRFLEVSKYFFSLCNLLKEVMRKPLNPVLSETYEGEVFFGEEHTGNDFARVTRTSKNHCKFFCEQISHHPPTTCVNVYNKEAGIYMSFTDHPTSIFMGTYVKLEFHQNIKIRFDKFSEVYSGKCPPMAIRLLRNFSEYIGKSKLTVNTSKIMCKTTFHPKPLLYGSYNTFESVVYNGEEKLMKLKGQWDQSIKISDYKKDDYRELMDRRTLKQGTRVLPDEKLPTDWSIIWKGLLEVANKEGTTKEITREKNKVEEAQRKIAATRKQKGEIWTSNHFDLQPNGEYTIKNYK